MGCLDIIAVDRNLECNSHYEVLNIASSDHFPVVATIRTFGADLVPIVKRSFAKVDYNLLAERCQSIVLDINSSTTVDLIVEQWYDRLEEILNELAPRKAFPARKKKSPWLTDHIRKLIDHRDHLALQFKHDSSSSRTISEELRVAK